MLPRPPLTSVASCVVGSYCKSSLGAPNIPSANLRAASWSALPVLVKYSPPGAPTIDNPRPVNSSITPGRETIPRVNSRGAAPSVSRAKLGLGASIPVFSINAAWLPSAAALARARFAASRRACAWSGPRSIRPGVIFAWASSWAAWARSFCRSAAMSVIRVDCWVSVSAFGTVLSAPKMLSYTPPKNPCSSLRLFCTCC